MPTPISQAIAPQATSFSQSVRTIARVVLALWRELATELLLRKAVRELRGLDDRTLRDLGLRRGDIDHVARNGRA